MNNTIELIVRQNLCVRCGGCIAACPSKGAIELGGAYYPEIIENNCTECRICLKVCPSNEENLSVLHQDVLSNHLRNEKRYATPILNLYVGYSNNNMIRKEASSGGIVTQMLIYLLDTGKADSVIVVTNKNSPLNPRAVLTGSPDDVRDSVGSKYTIVPVNECLKNVGEIKGPIAFAGLPCHIQSLRLWESVNPTIRGKIGFTISLFCNRNLEREASLYLLKRAKIDVKEVESLSYRHGSWPGRMAVKLRSGDWKHLHAHTTKEAYNYLSKVYYCEPCLNCLDYCGNLADMSVGDPWLRGTHGEYLFTDSRSLVLVRTQKGRQHLLEAEKAGYVSLEKIPESLFRANFFPLIEVKRSRALYSISKSRRKGKLYSGNHLGNFELPLIERFRGAIRNFPLVFYRSSLVRKPYLYFAFSRCGDRYTSLKNSFKVWRFSVKSNRHSKEWISVQGKSVQSGEVKTVD
jgi:coenzyme F420 hydrogenase subunit beta